MNPSFFDYCRDLLINRQPVNQSVSQSIDSSNIAIVILKDLGFEISLFSAKKSYSSYCELVRLRISSEIGRWCIFIRQFDPEAILTTLICSQVIPASMIKFLLSFFSSQSAHSTVWLQAEPSNQCSLATLLAFKKLPEHSVSPENNIIYCLRERNSININASVSCQYWVCVH